MLKFSNLNRVMGARDHFKTEASSKNLMNRGSFRIAQTFSKLSKIAMIALTAMFIASIANAQTVENIQQREQNDKKNQIGTHVAFGVGGYGPVRLLGAPNYNTKYYYSIGLDYSRMLSKRWGFCSGLEYTYNDMTKTPAPTGVERPSWSARLTLVTVPVQFKYHLGKLVYFNGGAFLNILAKERCKAWRLDENWYPLDKEDKYNIGILLGVGLGIGFEHEFNSGITLSLNPYARFNGIGKAASLQSEPLKHYKYLQGGISLGVGYKF